MIKVFLNVVNQFFFSRPSVGTSSENSRKAHFSSFDAPLSYPWNHFQPLLFVKCQEQKQQPKYTSEQIDFLERVVDTEVPNQKQTKGQQVKDRIRNPEKLVPSFVISER